MSSRLLIYLFTGVFILNFMLCSSFHHYYETSDCTPSALLRCNQSLTGQWPKPPTDFFASVSTSFVDPTVFKLYWKSYFDNLHCFQILVKSVGIPDVCKILSVMNIDTTYMSNDFSYEIPFGAYNRGYIITLQALPQPTNDLTVLSQKVNVVDCTRWSASFRYSYDGEQIMVTFDQGPKKCNFQNYSVTLYNEKHREISRKIVYEKVDMQKLTTIFSHNFCKGQYYISIEKAWDARQGCLFPDGTYRGCSRKRSQLETFIPRVPCYKDRILVTALDKTQRNHRVAIISVLVILFVVITFILFLYYIFRRCFKAPQWINGLALLLDDHPPHTEAVMKLAHCLREHDIDLPFASKFLKHNEENDQQSILAKVLKCDFVLLVTSSAFQKRTEAWEKKQDYVEFFKEINSNLITKSFLDDLYRWTKVFVCKFDHVSEKPHLLPGPCYSLPTEMKKMIEDISNRKFSLPSFSQQYWLDEFTIAVMKAEDYERSNPDWFQQKYFCPRVVAMDNIFQHTLSIREDISQQVPPAP